MSINQERKEKKKQNQLTLQTEYNQTSIAKEREQKDISTEKTRP